MPVRRRGSEALRALGKLVLVGCLVVVLSPLVFAADGPLAFPGAEGFGADTRGGRGGQVIFVTNLDDYRPGRDPVIPGSLRAAVEADGPRTVVFRVSGVIDLKAALTIRKPFLTIAGQSAPGDGICLRGFGSQVNADEVIIRHLRCRPGDIAAKELDALSVYKAKNVIIDHCSASWSVDETLSVTGEGCTNVTVSWCLITESLNRSRHAKGEHGYGSLIRTDGDITYHHNLYAHHKTRCPRPGTYGAERGILFDFRNNVIYDWVQNAGYSAEDRATMNYVGNYLKPGPSTRDRKYAFSVGGATTAMYVQGNVLVGGENASSDPWSLISHPERGVKATEPYKTAAVATQPAEVAFEQVLKLSGATLPARDAVDRRVVEQVRSGQGRIIDSQEDVGGWPEYKASAPPADRDQDGMPDAWEQRAGLNPDDAADQAKDRNGDGYTNLEEYLNSLASG
ncbi:MAG: pectate lyase [Planctomycetes bacterium]|nr:pectate lyase [Planctomycetota bacterium]